MVNVANRRQSRDVNYEFVCQPMLFPVDKKQVGKTIIGDLKCQGRRLHCQVADTTKGDRYRSMSRKPYSSCTYGMVHIGECIYTRGERHRPRIGRKKFFMGRMGCGKAAAAYTKVYRRKEARAIHKINIKNLKPLPRGPGAVCVCIFPQRTTATAVAGFVDDDDDDDVNAVAGWR